jgi:predicted nucleic acid-binding protein
MERIFIDTNIIVYANDARDTLKQKIALDIISKLMTSRAGTISTQVLQEYANVAIYKLQQKPPVVVRQIKLLEAMDVIQQTPDQIRRAIEISQLYQVGFWDACIIANAEYANCDTIYSEDFNTGQYYSGLKVKNPFL